MGHIREKIDQFHERDTSVVGVLAEKMENVKKYALKENLPFPLLVDEDRKTIKDYGVYIRLNFESYNISRPANFILDGQGIIRYIYIASHQRDFPEDEELYKNLDAILARGEVSA